MDELTLRHFMDQFGFSVNDMLTHGNPIYPPGTSPPSININSVQKKQTSNDSQVEKLHDFQQMYQKFAAGLLSMPFPGIVPPGHPMYSRQNSINALQNENKKLQKENFELKKQLEKISKKQKHS